MSEKATSSRYMQELDRWSEETIIQPLLTAWSGQEDNDPRTQQAVADACQNIKRSIRAKVLESYHNGQKGGGRGR